MAKKWKQARVFNSKIEFKQPVSTFEFLLTLLLTAAALTLIAGLSVLLVVAPFVAITYWQAVGIAFGLLSFVSFFKDN